MKKIIAFVKDSHTELRKVVWPSRDEVKSNTKLVLISVAMFAVVLGLVDFLLLAAVDFIF